VPEQAPQEVLRIECSWIWGEGLAQLVPQELAASSRLHVAVDRSEPFLPVSNQVAATRVARDGQSSSFDVESKLRLQGAPLPSTALLPAGATVRFGADERVKQTGLAAAELHWHANGALDLAWVVPARSVDEEGVEEQYRERVLLDVQAQIDSAGLVLVLPRAVDDKLDLALRLQVKRRIGAELGEEWLAMREVLLQSGESATRGSRLPSREESFRNELVDAWQELVAPAYRRAASWLPMRTSPPWRRTCMRRRMRRACAQPSRRAWVWRWRGMSCAISRCRELKASWNRSCTGCCCCIQAKWVAGRALWMKHCARRVP
jgi:hypothetical protein